MKTNRLIEPGEAYNGQQASVTLEHTWVNCVSYTRDYVVYIIYQRLTV